MQQNKAILADLDFSDSIISGLPGVFYIIDHDGNLLFWNQNLVEVSEYSNESVATMNAVDFFPETERQLIADKVKEVFITGRSQVEATFLTRTGKRIPYYFSGTRTKFQNKECLVGMGIDVSRRHMVEEELRDKERALLEAQRVAHVGSWEFDMVTHKVTWSEEMYRIFGYSKDVAPSFEGFVTLIHPDDSERFMKANRQSMQNLTPITSTHRIIRPDGQIRVLHSNGEFVFDQNGKPLKFVGIGQDITESKLIEEKIKEQAELLDKTNDAIFVLGAENRIIYWNKGAEKLYGWKPEEIVGKKAVEFLFETIPPIHEEALRVVAKTGDWFGEFEEITKDGKRITVETHWTLIRDEKGQPKSRLSVNRDVTERKKLQEQFLRAQRLESIGMLASGIAHDLNNVLGPIFLATQVLEKEISDPSKLSLIKMVESSAHRGAAMVKQVLTFSKGLGNERVVLQPRHLIQEMATIVKETFPKSISVDTDAQSDLWTISADATQMHQVLLNLCVNARDAMSRGGKLSLSARNVVLNDPDAILLEATHRGPHVRISVTDNGTGISKDVLPKIFDPFFTTKEPGKGTGLGLATIMTIVRGHEGAVDVQSEVGKGTTFSIYIPALASEEAQKEAELQRALPTGNGELILVVDDEESARDMAAAILEAYGYRVLVSSDGAEALGTFAENKRDISLVVTDMVMPILDGEGTIRALKKMKEEIRIVAVSGSEYKGQRLELFKKDVQAFLPKPYTAEKLLWTIHDILQR